MTEDAVKQPDSSLIYTYDNNSNKTGLIYGLSLDSNLYNAFGTFYTYDEENQLTSLSSAGGNFNFEYDDLSRMTKMSYPNGMETRMSYEGDMRLSKIEHIKTGLFDRVQNKFSYLYDNNDNKTRMQTFRKTLPINETLNYTYDKKNQLLTATNPLRSVANETFTYDLAGNLLRKQGQSQDSNYNENNQLTDDGTYTYKYDTKGNMIERIQKDNNKTTRYEWDIENQLIKVTTHETENAMPSETITYAYDGLGRRIEKNINGKIKRYIYDNEDILMEFDGDNLLQQHYIHGLGIDDPIAMIKNDFHNGSDNAKTYYYHKDGMGSITSLTDKDGKEIEKYIYNAFGKMTIYDEEDNKLEESQFDNPYSFTGREHDSETGLHYHRARYYNPELARWISEDPIEFNSGDMNLYIYVMSNPMKYTDPNGEMITILVNKSTISSAIFAYYYAKLELYDITDTDKYFHCMANCITSKVISPEMAHLLSQAWEEAKANYRQMCLKTRPEDEAANKAGREAAKAGQECKNICLSRVKEGASKEKLKEKIF